MLLDLEPVLWIGPQQVHGPIVLEAAGLWSGSAGLAPTWGLRGGYLFQASLLVSGEFLEVGDILACTLITLISAFMFTWCSACAHVCLQISPFHKDITYIVFWPTTLDDLILTNNIIILFQNKVTVWNIVGHDSKAGIWGWGYTIKPWKLRSPLCCFMLHTSWKSGDGGRAASPYGTMNKTE